MEDISASSASLAGIPLNNVLAFTAILLLVFVSSGVIYLSVIEWRDRRRRSRTASSRR